MRSAQFHPLVVCLEDCSTHAGRTHNQTALCESTSPVQSITYNQISKSALSVNIGKHQMSARSLSLSLSLARARAHTRARALSISLAHTRVLSHPTPLLSLSRAHALSRIHACSLALCVGDLDLPSNMVPKGHSKPVGMGFVPCVYDARPLDQKFRPTTNVIQQYVYNNVSVKRTLMRRLSLAHSIARPLARSLWCL